VNDRSFEDARRELERIVNELETGRADLDRAIALWQQGEELVRFCRTKLDGAQGEIEELKQRVEAARDSQ
jgi:exodeoxyribonuclease VII small subunit